MKHLKFKHYSRDCNLRCRRIPTIDSDAAACGNGTYDLLSCGT